MKHCTIQALAVMRNLALEVGYLAACIADEKDRDPRANETVRV